MTIISSPEHKEPKENLFSTKACFEDKLRHK